MIRFQFHISDSHDDSLRTLISNAQIAGWNKGLVEKIIISYMSPTEVTTRNLEKKIIQARKKKIVLKGKRKIEQKSEKKIDQFEGNSTPPMILILYEIYNGLISTAQQVVSGLCMHNYSQRMPFGTITMMPATLLSFY